MKRLSIGIAFMLIFSLLLCSAASADTITALATEVNPEHLEKTASYARILGYNEESNTLTVELIIPEVFAHDDVLSLREGDSIYTDNQEVVIQTIEKNDEYRYVLINDDSEARICLHVDSYSYDENYMPERYGRKTWISLAVIDCPVKDSLLFLDYIDTDACGDALKLPRVYPAVEFLDALLTGRITEAFDIPLNIENVYVVFDGNGDLATIQRYFVSWQ